MMMVMMMELKLNSPRGVLFAANTVEGDRSPEGFSRGGGQSHVTDGGQRRWAAVDTLPPPPGAFRASAAHDQVSRWNERASGVG